MLTEFRSRVQMNTCHFNSTLDLSVTWSKDLNSLAMKFFRVAFITTGVQYMYGKRIVVSNAKGQEQVLTAKWRVAF